MEATLWITGIVAAIIIAHVYYRLTVSKSLSFFLLVDDQPLSRVDQDVRNRLVVQFHDPEPPPANDAANAITVNAGLRTTVGALHHLQVIVANTGVRAITFAEAPNMTIPSSSQILDASLIYQKPADLGASVARLPVGDDGEQHVSLSVPMLNRNEFFVAKILLSEAINSRDLKLHLRAEELERTICIKELPPEDTKPLREAFEWPALWIGALLLIGAIGTGLVDREVYEASPLPSFQGGFLQFWGSFRLVHAAMIMSALFTGLLGAVGALFLISFGVQPFVKWRRVVLPVELRPGGIPTRPKK
jgi:hypothetical protein